jgi:tyrosyl-tRNA synthetase
MAGLLELTSAATVAQMLERSDFSKRYDEGSPISVMEFLYPLLQGYDSVAVEADIELGGSDQLWNLMMGRVVQERYGMDPQVAMTMPLLVGTDGVKKMSQSIGNYIGVEDAPEEMFGKTMSIPDTAMVEWFRLAADVDPEEASAIETGLGSGELHPGETKRRLARAVTALYWGEEAAGQAEGAFDQVFKIGGNSRRHRVVSIIGRGPGAASRPDKRCPRALGFGGKKTPHPGSREARWGGGASPGAG